MSLNSKSENLQSQNMVKSERNIKSFSPSIRLDSIQINDIKKKIPMKNNIVNNNFSRLNSENNENYKERVVHTENLSQKENLNNNKPQLIDIMKLINSNQSPISLSVLNKKFENFENSKHSSKSLKYIKGYSANTHQGTVR